MASLGNGFKFVCNNVFVSFHVPSIWVFQGLKIDDRQTRWDYIHDENLRRGENKYSTLQKVSDL